MTSSRPVMTKPPLKWVGGKTQIIDKVINLFPLEINNYHEPFLGGGSVLLALLSLQKQGKIKINGQIYASDFNPMIIHFYKTIQSDPESFILETNKLYDVMVSCSDSKMISKPTTVEEAMTSQESYYYWIRSQYNKLSPNNMNVVYAAMFIFLNKTCFRGLYREGPNGFNVPFGHYKNPSIISESHIRETSALIKNVVFTHKSFSENMAFEKGDFVYMDPPYVPVNATSFVGYTSSGFDGEQHKLLFDMCANMKSADVKFVLSNANVPLVRSTFPEAEYSTDVLLCKRSINSTDPSAKAEEVLVRNF